MEIVGVTSTDMTFLITFTYLKAKQENNFSRCLDSL